MRLFMFAVLGMVLGGCANHVDVSCPSCSVSSVDGSVSYSCTECTMEASVKEDMSLISVGRGD